MEKETKSKTTKLLVPYKAFVLAWSYKYSLLDVVITHLIRYIIWNQNETLTVNGFTIQVTFL